jgi:sortase A
MRRTDRRFAAVLMVVCLLVVGAVLWTTRTGGQASASGRTGPARPAVTTTLAPTTTTLPPLPRPIDVPNDAYAPEPVKEIGTIEVPRLGLVHPIFEGITLNNIDHGPSHWPGTALPGHVGNAVFAGHRVTHSHPFRNIDQLRPGDEVIFTVEGARSVYRVTGSQVVRPSETWIADQTSTPTATLFACHPPHSASYRYVVHLALAQAS